MLRLDVAELREDAILGQYYVCQFPSVAEHLKAYQGMKDVCMLHCVQVCCAMYGTCLYTDILVFVCVDVYAYLHKANASLQH